jgi:hypothetical protein
MRTTLLAALLALLCLGAAPNASRVRPADVHITFAGVIAHVLDPAHPARAVTLRGEGHMAHRATLFVRAADIVSSDVKMSCDGDGTCAIALDGLRAGFANASGRPRYEAGGSFDRYVPHLRAITGGAMQLAEAVHAAAPSGPVGAIFDLPDGIYSATPDSQPMQFVPDHERRGARTLSREVFLTTRIASPTLQFSNGTSIRFDDGFVELRITNEPLHDGAGHFDLHFDLAAAPVARPVLAGGSGAGLSGGCSNSNYP